ncbi:MAG: hypothetical protein M1831_002982 [Alyxoria varia]|nr:MAG: hypothetical protein M1831_002982 [Alyxoria varia]
MSLQPILSLPPPLRRHILTHLHPSPYPSTSLRHASSKSKPSRGSTTSGRITEKTRILSKPDKFNPPSHGSRRIRPRSFPGLQYGNEEDIEARRRKPYPNMLPPEGSWRRWFLTTRWVHLVLTLAPLTLLAIYSLATSFYTSCAYREELPTRTDWLYFPFQSLKQFLHIYNLHVKDQSAKKLEQRRLELEDVAKRREFQKAHGIEVGFLTGSWMDKLGTDEGRGGKEAMRQWEEEWERKRQEERRSEEDDGRARRDEAEEERRGKPRKRAYSFFGISWGGE